MENLEVLDVSTRTIADILADFVSALDEAIATYNVLEFIKKEDPKPNQLLFCHIVNGFDSFISSLSQCVILSNNDILKKYFFDEVRKAEEKSTLKDIISINESGLYGWMKIQVEDILENDVRRKRHSQRLEMLIKNVDLQSNTIYVSLMGIDQYASGCLKKKPTRIDKQTPNHKTTPEKLIGYADILYEKRNAVTHNRNNYPSKVIDRLNKNWDLQIERESVIIRRSTIKSLVRFYTSVTLKIIETKKIKEAAGDRFFEFKTDLENLKNFENIVHLRSQGESDERSVAGGIMARKSIVKEEKLHRLTVEEYAKKFGISRSTARRDFMAFEKDGFFCKK